MGSRIAIAVLLSIVIGGGCGNAGKATEQVITLDVVPNEHTATAIGSPIQFVAMARTASGAVIPDAQISWVSTDLRVARIDKSGVATTTGNGTTEIRALTGSVTATARLVVKQIPSVVTASTDALILDRWGDNASLAIEVVDAAGTRVDGVVVHWSSTNASVADVDATGRVTSWTDGDAVIRAELSLDGRVFETVEVSIAVVIQRNPAAEPPPTLPSVMPVLPPVTWHVQTVSTMWTISGDDIPHRSIVLDADQDGDDDLILIRTERFVGDGTPAKVEVRAWLNDGGGLFTDGTGGVFGSQNLPWVGPSDLQYGDFNGDGLKDVFVPQTGWELGPCDGTRRYCPGGKNMLLLQRPEGGLVDVAPTQLEPYDWFGYTHTGASGDVDCDGDIDLFEGNGGEAPAKPHLQMNQGSGYFRAEDSRLGPPIYDPVEKRGTEGSVFCDLDRDGDPDLVHSTDEGFGPSTFIAVNDGFGHFRTLDSPIFDGNAWHFFCADFDRDGYPDLLFEQGFVQRIRILRNTQAMSFLDVTATALPAGNVEGTHPVYGVVDLNLDGWPDIIPTMHLREQAVLWNAGNGTFAEVPVAPGTGIAGGGVYLAVGDFDSDGRLDLHWDYNTPGHGPGNEILWNR